MNNIVKQILTGTILLTALIALFNSNFARTDTNRESGMTVTTTERPAIDQTRPQTTETAVFALG